jgi:hypothetical protein
VLQFAVAEMMIGIPGWWRLREIHLFGFREVWGDVGLV